MTNKQTPQDIKDTILLRMLEDVPFDGWTLKGAELAAQELGYEDGTVRALFPAGVSDVLVHFSDYADRAMLAAMDSHDLGAMRIRERIRSHILARLDVLAAHKEAVGLSLAYWKFPARQGSATKMLWRTADRIWSASGDHSTDYNRYTKRLFLSGVLGSTVMVWLRDESADHQKTKAFLDNRIENVMQFGKIIGKLKA